MNTTHAATLILALLLAGVASAQTAPSTAPVKPWLKDFKSYSRTHRGNWLVAHSVQPALTAEEAMADARREAARGLAIQIQPRMGNTVSDPWLRNQLEASLMAGNWIEDQQVTASDRPYGTIFSASLLINTAPRNFNRILADLQLATTRERSRLARVAGLCAILTLAIACLFLIVNSATHGFLRFRLALISLVLIATGIFGITHLI
jgi:hypothetical protein